MLDTVIVNRYFPTHSLLSGYIESYNWLHFLRPVEVKTIPNGRLDAVICIEGEVEWWLPNKNKFTVLPKSGFFPLTREPNYARSSNIFKCISIKFFPHVLTLSILQKQPLTEPVSFSQIFNKRACETLHEQIGSTSNIAEQVNIMEKFFLDQLFRHNSPDPWIQEVIQALEHAATSQVKIESIAALHHMSIKTLERRFKKLMGLSPKLFSGLLQLQQTTRIIKANARNNVSHGDLTEALGQGYYDQSHFVKACQKITGLSPRQLFTQLPHQVTDFIITEHHLPS